MASDEKKVDHFMPLWIGDYLADTSHLGHGEHGAYLLLLMAMWRRGGRLPNDHVQLARIAACPRNRWMNVWGMIAQFFEVEDGYLVQRRLRRELDAVLKSTGQKVAAGRASAAARRASTGSAQPGRGSEIDSHPPGVKDPISNTEHDGGKNHKPPESLTAPSNGARTAPRTGPEDPYPYPDPQPDKNSDPDARERGTPVVSRLSRIGPPRLSGTYRPAHVGAVTPAFLSVYEAYPNPNGKQAAAQVWQDIAADYPGGEAALASAILAQFEAGFLRRKPYNEPGFIKALEGFLRERRWEDDWRNAGRERTFTPSDMPEV